MYRMMISGRHILMQLRIQSVQLFSKNRQVPVNRWHVQCLSSSSDAPRPIAPVKRITRGMKLVLFRFCFNFYCMMLKTGVREVLIVCEIPSKRMFF